MYKMLLMLLQLFFNYAHATVVIGIFARLDVSDAVADGVNLVDAFLFNDDDCWLSLVVISFCFRCCTCG